VLAIHWFPVDASVQAKRTRTLYDVLLIASVPIFVLVITVIGFSVWWFRMRPGEELMDGPPIHGNTRLEVIWTIAPALLIVFLCAYSVSVLYANEANKKGALTVDVTARQWAFEFSYPEPGNKAVYSPFLYLPNGRPVVFKIRSLDVIHSFFVPNFSEKIDAVPGITTTLRVTPTRKGTYVVECTELCGAGHAFMRSTTYVLKPAAFSTWLAKQPLQTKTANGLPTGSVLPVAVPLPSGIAGNHRHDHDEHPRHRPGDLYHHDQHARHRPGDLYHHDEQRIHRPRRRSRRHQPRGRQGDLHRGRHLRLVPHPRRRRRHRHDRSGPDHAAGVRLREPRLAEDPRHDAEGVHRQGDHRSLRIHSHRVHEGDHALDFCLHARPDQGRSAGQLLSERD
jgi:cytochrome c oxidase subunit II